MKVLKGLGKFENIFALTIRILDACLPPIVVRVERRVGIVAALTSLVLLGKVHCRLSTQHLFVLVLYILALAPCALMAFNSHHHDCLAEKTLLHRE